MIYMYGEPFIAGCKLSLSIRLTKNNSTLTSAIPEQIRIVLYGVHGVSVHVH